MSQHTDALANGQRTRMLHAGIRAELDALDAAAGRRRVAELLRDPGEAGSIRLDALLSYVRRLSDRSVDELLVSAGIPTYGLARTRRLSTFTARQRTVLADELERRADVCDARRAA